MPYFLVVRRLEADKAEMEAERERWKEALLEREGDMGRIEDQMQVCRRTPPGGLLAQQHGRKELAALNRGQAVWSLRRGQKRQRSPKVVSQDVSCQPSHIVNCMFAPAQRGPTICRTSVTSAARSSPR
jgi:hypothetical protein